MDKTLRNTIIGIIATIILSLGTAWININSRISILEVQVQNDHQVIQNNNRNIDEMKTMLADIQKGVQHLQDVKEDKK